MPFKIYFCGSIRGGRQDAELYGRIISKLKATGTVLTEHVGDSDVIQKEIAKNSDKFIHDRDIEWLTETDVVVAEVTQASLGVGYELGRAVAMGKPILCLYRPSPEKRLSAMIEGAKNDTNFFVKHYEESQLDDILKEFLGKFT